MAVTRATAKHTCSTSVVSVNCRMSQKPKMAVTLWPGTMGSMSPPLLMLLAMTSAPASPKPIASRLRPEISYHIMTGRMGA